MVSYVVTGSSRGIGVLLSHPNIKYLTDDDPQFGFIQALASKKDNQVFAVIRNPATATDLEALAKSNPNLHIVTGDATSPEDLDRAANEVGKVTGGKLDVLIANVGGGSDYDWKMLGEVYFTSSSIFQLQKLT